MPAAPEPREWLSRPAGVIRLADRDVIRLLEQSQRSVDAILRQIDARTAGGIGDILRREQLLLVKRELKREQSALWAKLGDVVKARRLEAASRVSALGQRLDAHLLKTVAGMVDGADLASAIAQSEVDAAKSGIDRMMARVKGQSYVPLSERVYRSSVVINETTDRLVNSALSRGLSAKEFAREAAPFINPATPGGVRYASMRLARTEINNAAHAVSINNALAKPWVEGMQWHLSGSHPKTDICNDLASGGLKGDGIYLPEEVPAKPHPHCFCFVVPVVPDDDQFIDNLLGGQYNDYLKKYERPVGGTGTTIVDLARPAKLPGLSAVEKPKPRAPEAFGNTGVGRDLVADGGITEQRAADLLAKQGIGLHGDNVLDEISKMQGWDVAPRVVEPGEIDAAVKNGAVEMFRGVAEFPETPTNAQMAESFRTGAVRNGNGIYGNGTYTTPIRKSAEKYAGFDIPLVKNAEDGIIRMYIDPKARVIELTDLLAKMESDLSRAFGLIDNQGIVVKPPAGMITSLDDLQSDPGRYAALHGYDVIRIVAQDGAGGGLQYNVLNRAAVIIERALTPVEKAGVKAARQKELDAIAAKNLKDATEFVKERLKKGPLAPTQMMNILVGEFDISTEEARLLLRQAKEGKL